MERERNDTPPAQRGAAIGMVVVPTAFELLAEQAAITELSAADPTYRLTSMAGAEVLDTD